MALLLNTVAASLKVEFDGSLDPSFTSVITDNFIKDIIVQSDNKIMITGYFTTEKERVL